MKHPAVGICLAVRWVHGGVHIVTTRTPACTYIHDLASQVGVPLLFIGLMLRYRKKLMHLQQVTSLMSTQACMCIAIGEANGMNPH